MEQSIPQGPQSYFESVCVCVGGGGGGWGVGEGGSGGVTSDSKWRGELTLVLVCTIS